MEIETLQIKRVTGNWDEHKSIKPLKGEYILVDLADNSRPKTLVLGTSTDGVNGHSLEDLILNDEHIIPFKSDITKLTNTLSGLNPTENTQNISSESNDKGNGTSFAYSNHIHKIEKKTITDVLKDDNGFEYHGIKIGTDDPNDINLPGNIGDIYIRYENK